MKLRPIRSEEVKTVAEWLTREENTRWLDFGRGHRSVDATTLSIMIQRDIHVLRVFTPDGDDRPIGVTGLSDVDREFGTATLWFVLGDKDYVREGYTSRACTRLLAHGFDEVGLGAVNAWTLENNGGGQGVLERLGFRRFGRQRRCHRMDGEAKDRIWYDLLPEELIRDHHDDTLGEA